MRVGLHGGTRAREEEDPDDGGGDDDDDVYKVVVSVASDDVREDAMRAAEEAVDGSRAVWFASSLGFSVRRCESGKSFKAAAASGGLAPKDRNRVFTVLSSDIGTKIKK